MILGPINVAQIHNTRCTLFIRKLILLQLSLNLCSDNQSCSLVLKSVKCHISNSSAVHEHHKNSITRSGPTHHKFLRSNAPNPRKIKKNRPHPTHALTQPTSSFAGRWRAMTLRSKGQNSMIHGLSSALLAWVCRPRCRAVYAVVCVCVSVTLRHSITRSSAIAEGPRDAIVSTNPADTRRRHIPRLT